MMYYDVLYNDHIVSYDEFMIYLMYDMVTDTVIRGMIVCTNGMAWRPWRLGRAGVNPRTKMNLSHVRHLYALE